MIRSPRNIAIIKPSALGDIVHALPVLTALRHRYPSARITWIVNRSFEPLLVGHPHLDATITFDRGVYKRPLSAVAYSWRFANELRKQRFDCVVDLQGLLRTGLMCAATGAAVRIGFANAREGATRFYSHSVAVPDADTIHAIDRYRRIADALDASEPPEFVVPIRTQETQQVLRELHTLPRPWIAVAAGAKWVTKRWPTQHFVEVLNRAHAAVGGTVLLLGAGDDRELSHAIATNLRGEVHDYTGHTSLPKLVAILSQVDIMFANDTGPLHLAAALDRPCVSPFLCTKTIKHGPYGSRNRGVETRVSCGGSYLKRCPTKMECMTELTPDRVWQVFAEVLEQCRIHNRPCG
jgi:heptosyltransferase I